MPAKIMTPDELREEIERRIKGEVDEHGDAGGPFWHSLLCALDDLELAQGYLAAMIDDVERWARGAPRMGE